MSGGSEGLEETSAQQLGEAPPPVRPTDSFADAARAAMWPQVARMLEVEPALRDAAAGDELKRYRVATRRLRAALRVFDVALPRRRVREIQPELRDLARAVGRVRDLDVRSAGLAAWAGDRAGDVEPLRASWSAERSIAAAEMADRLDGKRHARLLADLTALVRASDGDGDAKRGRRAARDRAGSAIWAGFEELRAAVSDLDHLDLEALHDVRILAKRLRYTLEFLAPVLGADRDWLVARLVELQDHLGALHDADLAGAAARTFLDADGSELSDPQRSTIEAYAVAQASTVEQLTADLRKVTTPVTAPGFAKRLSRAILGPSDAAEANPA